MKKLVKVASVLLAIIFVFSCFSVNAFAGTDFKSGKCGSSRYHIYLEAYCDFYCATLNCRAKSEKNIETNAIYEAPNGIKEYCVDGAFGSANDNFVYFYKDLDEEKTYCCATYYVGTHWIGELTATITDYYIPEEADD